MGMIDTGRLVSQKTTQEPRFFDGGSEEQLIHYQLLLENMSDGFVYGQMLFDDSSTSLDMTIIEVNKAFEKIMGIPRQRVLGQKATEIFPALSHDPTDWLGKMGRIALGGGRKVFEGQFGPDRWFRVSIFSQKKGYIATIFADITERKKNEVQLRYQARFVQAIPDSIISTDRQLRIKRWNPAATSLYGWSEQEVFGKPITFYVQIPLLTEPHLVDQRQVLFQKGAWSGDILQHRKDGTPIVVSSCVITITDAAENVTGFVTVNRDITDRKRMEDNLRQSEEQYRTLTEHIPDAIARFDLDLRHLYMNPAYQHLTRRPPEAVIGKSLKELATPPELTRHLIPKLNEVARTGHPSILEYRLLPPPRAHYYQTLIIPEMDSSDKPKSLLTVTRDLTAIKKTEEKLVQITKDLTESNKDLESFNYSVAHDLRAPLRSINGFSGALSTDYKQCLDAQGQYYLDRIHNSTLNMADLIDDILRLSHISRTQLHYELVNISDQANAIVEHLKQQAPERSARISIQQGIMISGDRKLLNILLENLLKNAWKFTRDKATADIVLTAQDKQNTIILTFKDNGAGFDMAFKDKLFKPFQRLHSVEEFPGIGIGLAMVKRIVEKHGGHVWSEGEVGKGATFFVELPKNKLVS
jgi:PAS domain S-box-containing protein